MTIDKELFPDIEQYKDYLSYQRLLTQTTVDDYLTKISIFINFLGRSMLEATEGDLRDYIKYLTVNNRCKISTIREYLCALKSYYKYTKKHDLLFFLDHTIRLKKERTVATFPTPEEIAALKKTMATYKSILDKPSSKRLYAKILRDISLFEMMLAIGARSKELRNIRVKDLDMTNQSVFILSGKGGHQRMCIFDKYTLECALEHISYNGLSGNDFLFEFYSTGSLNAMIARWTSRAKINSKLHSHSFRHYHITEAQRQGVNIQAVADQVGHVSLNTTRHYTHLDLVFRKDQYTKYSN